MRSLALAFTLALATAPALGQDAGPAAPIKRGQSYDAARGALLKAGFQPVRQTEEGRCAPGREDVCDAYPETQGCSGTGFAFCGFTWRRGAQTLFVTTSGEEVGELRVAGWRRKP